MNNKFRKQDEEDKCHANKIVDMIVKIEIYQALSKMLKNKPNFNNSYEHKEDRTFKKNRISQLTLNVKVVKRNELNGPISVEEYYIYIYIKFMSYVLYSLQKVHI